MKIKYSNLIGVPWASVPEMCASIISIQSPRVDGNVLGRLNTSSPKSLIDAATDQCGVSFSPIEQNAQFIGNLRYAKYSAVWVSI